MAKKRVPQLVRDRKPLAGGGVDSVEADHRPVLQVEEHAGDVFGEAPLEPERCYPDAARLGELVNPRGACVTPPCASSSCAAPRGFSLATLSSRGSDSSFSASAAKSSISAARSWSGISVASARRRSLLRAWARSAVKK